MLLGVRANGMCITKINVNQGVRVGYIAPREKKNVQSECKADGRILNMHNGYCLGLRKADQSPGPRRYEKR